MDQTQIEGTIPSPFEKKQLPKFSCSVRKGKFGALQITVYVPEKYIEKVIGKTTE